MLWFTSDLHLGDEAILRFAHRPWKTVAAMNDALIEGINERVAPDDRLYVLGDISHLMASERVDAYLRRIACQNVYLVRGNHDADRTFAHRFEDERDYLELKYRGQKLCLMHYPLMTWNGVYRGSIHLHGHIHSEGPAYNERNRAQGYFRYDVGVDANGYRPVSFTELLAFYQGARPVTPRRDGADAGAQGGTCAADPLDQVKDTHGKL